MKKQLNEIKRMQKLAGVIKESQQLNEDIHDDIDQDLMNGDLDQEEQIEYLRDIINYCQSKINEIEGNLNESQLNEIEGQQVADFLNQHKEEVFEKMFGYLKNEEGPDWGDKQYSDISINDMGEWEEFVDEEDGYTCARTDLYNYGMEAQARMTPFPDVDTLPEYLGETKIAGKTIYYFTFTY